jgi:hypothetical protein
MADKRITDLPEATLVNADDVIPIVTTGTTNITKKVKTRNFLGGVLNTLSDTAYPQTNYKVPVVEPGTSTATYITLAKLQPIYNNSDTINLTLVDYPDFVVTADVKNNSITGQQLATSSVAASAIVDGTITNSKITDSTIDYSKLSQGAPTWDSAGTVYVSGDIYVTGNISGGTNIVSVADTTYTIQLSDNGGTITSTNTGNGLTATVVNSNQYPIGFQVNIMQLGTARILLSGQNTVINQADNFFRTNNQYSTATLVYTGLTTNWVLYGDVYL